jgi:uncharacterized protein YigE (DUF2233 family)
MKWTAWTHPAQVQSYEEIGQLVVALAAQPGNGKLNMYYGDGDGQGMQLAGCMLRSDFNWKQSRIDFIPDGVWGWGEILPIGFYTTDGRKTFEIRSASGGVSAADIFYMVMGRQSFVNNPASISYIDNLLVPTGY